MNVDRTQFADVGGMLTPTIQLTLSVSQGRELEQVLRQSTLSQAVARRARVMLALA